MRTQLKYGLLLTLLIACSKQQHSNAGDASLEPLQGPIDRPASGYGAEGSYKVATLSFPNPQYRGTNVTVFYPEGTTTARPVVFYSHPYGGEDVNYNRELFEFIARKGYVAVFVPYPTTGVSIDERYNTLWAGFLKAATDYPAIIDTRKVAFMGHSFGGGASIGLGYKAFTEKGWGQNGRVLFTMAPWYSYQITPQQLSSFPANTKMISQVYEDDIINDHRLAIDIFKNINIPDAEKDFIYIRSSVVADYTYYTNHTLPNSRSAWDALDYYGVYRLLDALLDYSFNNNAAAAATALGNGSQQQITMPSYKGQQMAPLEVSDSPVPKFGQSRYGFKCSSTDNPRSAYCN